MPSPLSHFLKSISAINGMSLVKKVFIVFLCLFFFVLIVERPGDADSRRQKGAKLLFPKLLASQVTKIEFGNLPEPTPTLALSKVEGGWRVVNGHSFPADRERIERFLSIVENMVSGQVVSNNPDRFSIFALDEKTSPHVKVWDSRERLVADFVVGMTDPEGRQFIRKATSNEALQVSQSLDSFLLQDLDGWKDKMLFSLSEPDTQRLVLSKGLEDTILERKAGQWRMLSPEDRDPDPLALRTLFDSLKSFRADKLADSLEGTQADFEKPDYKISARLADDSLKLVVFSASKDHSTYYAKNGDQNLIYLISAPQVENLFGLKLKGEKPEK